ncbi:MAG: single-stranded DNA-binding protein [Caldilineaceae bacterium]
MRYTASGVPVTSFSVAVNRVWTGQDGQRNEKTTWFRVSAWRQLAERCGQYLTKGQKVLVIGEIDEPNIWTDQQGNARASLEITARDVRFLSSRDEAGMGGGMSSSMASVRTTTRRKRRGHSVLAVGSTNEFCTGTF